MRKGSGFVPRPSARRVVGVPLSWETSLLGWSATAWWLTATVWAAVEDPQRKAITSFARKTVKKQAHWTTRTGPGGVVTNKPVGTRMGKGKGKPQGHRTWWCIGTPVGVITGKFPARLGVLYKRSSNKLVVTPTHY